MTLGRLSALSVLAVVLVGWSASQAGATRYLYHEQSLRPMSVCTLPFEAAPYATAGTPFVVRAELGYSLVGEATRLYFTTDGSVPAVGLRPTWPPDSPYGVPLGSTQVVAGSLACYGIVDGVIVGILEFRIPAQTARTVVRYIIGSTQALSDVWEVFANSGDCPAAYGCQPHCRRISTCATVFGYVVAPAPITAVTFHSLTAARSARGVTVRWLIASETGILGFHVYRQRGQGRRLRLTRGLMLARRVGQYRFVDRATPASAARYWIQIVSLDGATSWRGPVRAPSL